MLKAIFISGTYSSRAFLVFQFISFCQYEGINNAVLSEIKDIEIALKNVNKSYIQYIELLQTIAHKKQYYIQLLIELTKICNGTSFSDIYYYSKIIKDTINQKNPDSVVSLDISKSEVLTNPVLRYDIQIISNYLNNPITENDNSEIEFINPIIYKILQDNDIIKPAENNKL